MRSDGTTGTLSDTILTAEADGHRVTKDVSVAGNVTRTVVSKAYDANGKLAYSITSVTSANGLSITNSYDDNGDGVVDRFQTINTVINADTSRTETLENRAGNVLASSVLLNRTLTTTSPDGKIAIIQRDSEGGGWFDQVETRTENADGSHDNVVSNYARNGSTLLSKQTNTLDATGRIGWEYTDADGLGGAGGWETREQTLITETSTSRTTLIRTWNRDGTQRSSENEVIAANGRDKVISRDHDGDGIWETVENLAVTLNSNGSRTSVLDLRNADGSKRGITSYTQSADTLSKTVLQDMDNDAAFERRTSDVTLINADGSRQHDVEVRSADNTLLTKTRETLGADKVTAATWVDANRDGVFQATDLVRSVTVDAATQMRTENVYARNVDGSFSSHLATSSLANGKTSWSAYDADGDGDIDVHSSENRIELADGRAQVDYAFYDQDNQRFKHGTEFTSADGLTTTSYVSVDGDNDWDAVTVDVKAQNVDGSTSHTELSYGGDATTLLSRTVFYESADRLTKTQYRDTDGNVSVRRRPPCMRQCYAIEVTVLRR